HRSRQLKPSVALGSAPVGQGSDLAMLGVACARWRLRLPRDLPPFQSHGRRGKIVSCIVTATAVCTDGATGLLLALMIRLLRFFFIDLRRLSPSAATGVRVSLVAPRSRCLRTMCWSANERHG